jgi:hypothetical protein
LPIRGRYRQIEQITFSHGLGQHETIADHHGNDGFEPYLDVAGKVGDGQIRITMRPAPGFSI